MSKLPNVTADVPVLVRSILAASVANLVAFVDAPVGENLVVSDSMGLPKTLKSTEYLIAQGAIPDVHFSGDADEEIFTLNFRTLAVKVEEELVAINPELNGFVMIQLSIEGVSNKGNKTGHVYHFCNKANTLLVDPSGRDLIDEGTSVVYMDVTDCITGAVTFREPTEEEVAAYEGAGATKH